MRSDVGLPAALRDATSALDQARRPAGQIAVAFVLNRGGEFQEGVRIVREASMELAATAAAALVDELENVPTDEDARLRARSILEPAGDWVHPAFVRLRELLEAPPVRELEQPEG